MSVEPRDIIEANERIRPLAHRTPVLTSRTVNQRTGRNIFFKCENFQRGGAFKIRGAANFIGSLSAEQLSKGVVAYSSGNHAQAVAIAAEAAGTKATLVMPDDAPRAKLEATRSHGPEIITYDRRTQIREEIGREIAERTGAVLVPPYDHPLTIAGQGTTALELMEQVENLDALVVCVGGGGLISGCSIAAKYVRPGTRIFGVEPEGANDTYQSLMAGERVEIPNPDTIADGLRSPSPGEITFPIIARNVEEILLVTEDEIKESVKFLLTRMKILVEPSGAVSAAAVLHGKLPPDVKTAGVVLSGGNVDFGTLASL